MILEKFIQETRHLSITHCFFETKKLTIFNTLQTKHSRFKLHNLSNETPSYPPCDIVFIEIGEGGKDKLKVLLKLLTQCKPLVSYIFADDVENKLLLKFALHFAITDVLPLINETQLLDSIFTKNPSKLDEKLSIFRKLSIEQHMEQSFAFFIFQESELTYANAKAKALFGETDLRCIQEILWEDDDIASMLGSNENKHNTLVIENESHEKNTYVCSVNHFERTHEKMLTLVEYKAPEGTGGCSSVLTRFDFIERLKDKLVQQNITQRPLSLIFFNISNLDKLGHTFTNVHLYESLKKLLAKIFQFKSPHQELAQWSPNLYVLLCEDCNFKDACEQTLYLHQELVQATVEEKITPIVVSSTLCTEKQSLNDLLWHMDKISSRTLLPNEIQNLKFYEIGYLDNVIDPKEQIAYLMRNCIHNKIPIKLLNIYKGLCINTNSFIIKYSDDAYHLYCENLQGYAMQIEGETVLQAPNFPKDIKAEVSLVDIKKAFVVIKNLSFMPYSANNRQHTRVQTSIRTPVQIKYAQKSSLQGEIVDISVNSIAMKCSKILKENLLNQNVRLSFSLPYEEGENGYVMMEIEGKVTLAAQREDHTKVVVLLGELKKPYDDYLLHYMYSRQKELILEIKRATKVYN